MVEALDELVREESPSNDPDASKRCAQLLAAMGARLLGSAPEILEIDGRSHLRWSFGTPRVLVLGHLDTVWPLGTAARWPFSIRDDIASGPGAFDMKAGLVQMLFALRSLDDLDGVMVLINSDEEIGSPTSRELIETSAVGLQAALVLEPSADGALKIARKGTSSFEVLIAGRAAHAGLDPESGVNATIELAHQILRIKELADPLRGTTVTPTVITGGTTVNTVPSAASVHIDVRAESADEQARVERGLRDLEPVLAGAGMELGCGPTTPPLPASASAKLFAEAQLIASSLGIGPLEGVSVGGGSDGNRTAAVGIPTLDGLGAVGGRAHAEGEYVSVRAMPERAALVAELVRWVLRTDPA
ncbi:MAG: M20 family metallopeptidase [Actinobacteria bacterium]|nr:M20 family metallopeptidase [Actinomycetota bacterium]